MQANTAYYDKALRTITMGRTVGASNWPRDLDAARRGEGDFGVPMPNPIMTRAQALVNMNRAQILQNQIQYMLDNTHQDPWDATPMQSIIAILKQTVYAYQVFIAEMDKVAIPESPVDVTPQVPETPVEEENTVMDFVKKNAIPLAIGGFLLVNALLPKNKKIIKF